MKNSDAELLQRVLTKDETAFEELVEKYKKQVHALAWRKIGDFHIAEEITQDAFLKVYQELHTLRDLCHFSGWLYVITANLCATWHRKKRIQTQPLEDEEITMAETDFFSQHVVEERSETAAETHREIVKKLLAKLKESERTVMTLHYLGEMTVEEISKFIGVSAGTIKSRLQRARNRLQKEEHMIREALEHFQISPNLTDNILKEVSQLKPAAPSGSKPLIPWTAAAASAVLILLMLGVGSQFLAHFQKPYSFDAQTEMTVELVDTPIVLNLDTQPREQNQFGNANAIGENDNSGQNPDEVLLADGKTEGEDISIPKREWVEFDRQAFAHPKEFLETPEGDLYTLATSGHLYKLKNDGESWEHIIDISLLGNHSWFDRSPMAKWKDTLYIVLMNELYASKDDGKTWGLVHTWEEAEGWDPSELVLTEHAFYTVFNRGTFRSEDHGKTWRDMSDEFQDAPASFIVIQDTVFAASGTGFYRRNAGKWERLEFSIPEAVSVSSVAGTKDYLYVMALDPNFDPQAASEGSQRTWWILRSSDLGNTWKDITPTNAWHINGWPPGITLIAQGETLLAMEDGMVRSIDAGETWMEPMQPDSAPSMKSYYDAASLEDGIIYIGSGDGFKRSRDGGESWDSVEIPAKRTFTRNILDNLIVYDGRDNGQEIIPSVYAKSWRTIVKTTDKGKSWKSIKLEVPMTAPDRESQPGILKMKTVDGTLYAKGERVRDEVNFYQISEDGNKLELIKGVPTLYSGMLMSKLRYITNNPLALSDKSAVETLQEDTVGATQFFKELVELAQGGFQNQFVQIQRVLIDRGLNGAFAVSGDTVYLEYNFKLFRWTQGEREWADTGVEETIGLTIKKPDGTYLPAGLSPVGVLTGSALKAFRVMQSFKLAVSGDTVYVGKRDGHLLVSYDRGNNWEDITQSLPFPVIAYKEIKFAGAKVYVSTDTGVTMSNNGTHWQAITDAAGENIVMEYLAVDGRRLYGMTDKTGVYLLANGTWEQVVTETPEKVHSLAVDGNTLYVGTQKRGMLHYVLE